MFELYSSSDLERRQISCSTFGHGVASAGPNRSGGDIDYVMDSLPERVIREWRPPGLVLFELSSPFARLQGGDAGQVDLRQAAYLHSALRKSASRRQRPYGI